MKFLKIKSKFVPKNWHPNDPNSFNEWIKKLPTPDIKKVEEIDERYEHLRITNSYREEYQKFKDNIYEQQK